MNRLGLIKFVCYKREFVVSEFINVLYMDFGTEKMGNFFRYDQVFFITKFVITKFDCISFFSTNKKLPLQDGRQGQAPGRI